MVHPSVGPHGLSVMMNATVKPYYQQSCFREVKVHLLAELQSIVLGHSFPYDWNTKGAIDTCLILQNRLCNLPMLTLDSEVAPTFDIQIC